MNRMMPMEPYFSEYRTVLLTTLDAMAAVLEGLPDAALDWVPGPEMNSLAVLIVHTLGSTRFWVGDVALGDESHRVRSTEFAASGLTVRTLQRQIADTRAYLYEALTHFRLEDLAQMRPVPGRDEQFTVAWALLHALEHANQHLGHAQITRQMWEQQSP
jgi:hypothetical protein